MPAGEQGAACVLGAERFEEFATQVGRRVDLGVPLIRETIDRVSATRTTSSTPAEGVPSGNGVTICEPGVQASSVVDDASVSIAAVREDAATLGLQAVEAALFPDSATCRRIEEGEGVVPSRRSVPTWLTASRQVEKKRVEKRFLEAARRASAMIPAGDISESEKPDLTPTSPDGLIGIEVTELLRKGNMGPFLTVAEEGSRH